VEGERSGGETNGLAKLKGKQKKNRQLLQKLNEKNRIAVVINFGGGGLTRKNEK